MQYYIQMHLLRSLALGIVCIVFCSCASIVSGTKQEVNINSDPAKAQIRILDAKGNEVYTGVTPAMVKLRRNSTYDVFVKMDGYKEEKIHIEKGFNSWFLGNLLCGGIIGIIVDASNGAMNKLEPEAVNVSLATVFNDDGKREVYATFNAYDSDGQLRTLLVPLIKA